MEDQAVDLAVEVAATGDSSSCGIQPLLPGDDPRVRGEPVLDDDEH
jgi:hypothetical protein